MLLQHAEYAVEKSLSEERFRQRVIIRFFFNPQYCFLCRTSPASIAMFPSTETMSVALRL